VSALQANTWREHVEFEQADALQRDYLRCMPFRHGATKRLLTIGDYKESVER
jgi:hypothetical protein